MGTFTNRAAELDALQAHFASGKRVATITGPRGIGKTALAYMFSHLADRRNAFPGGTQRVSAIHATRDIVPAIEESVVPTSRERSLLLIDDFEAAPAEFRRWINTLADRFPSLSILISGNEVPTDIREALNLELAGFDLAAWSDLIAKRMSLVRASSEQAQRLFEALRGNPGFADVIDYTLRDGLFDLNTLLRGLVDFERSGILGPDGKPISSVPEAIRFDVADSNAVLLAKLSANPEEIRALTPRKFEEIVAELLTKQGYEIELTPESKDGGFDMYAARKDGLGSFLYLVECKRYTPPNRVGVQVVRSLHGVVQQQQANAGIVVTSSFFTRGASDFQETLPFQIQLKDYIALQKWLGLIK